MEVYSRDTVNGSFDLKKNSALNFFLSQFLLIKTLDTDWLLIQIRYHIKPKMLDPDPYQINTDPKP
jgi:hypothetical protein